MSKPKKVCVIGSGNWGTTIARIVADNAQRRDNLHNIVTMYVYEEMINGKKLSDIINEEHENVKYLPGYIIPSNVVAVPDIVVAAKDADALIFVVPHQFVRTICANLLGKIKPTACALSLVKGFEEKDDGGIELISSVIHKLLRINVSVMMGAHLASEVAEGMFAEATLGCANKQIGPLWCDIIGSDTFRVTTTDDMTSVEIYSGLKNVVALGAGLIDGLKVGLNTKATMIRMGMLEIIKFVDLFYPGGRLSTFFESCGIADYISTCITGRNRRVAEAFARSGRDLQSLQEELLKGEPLQGAITASVVHTMLAYRELEHRFPLITTIHLICQGSLSAPDLLEAMKTHTETSLVILNSSF